MIDSPNGLVLLTNQYQPNTSLTDGDITVTGNALFNIGGIKASGVGGDGSDVILDSRSDIKLTSSFIDSSSDSAQGGNIALMSNSDVLLTNGASLNVNGGGGGNISIKAQNLDILEGSSLSAGIATGLGSIGSQAGDITLNASGEVNIENSIIRNDVNNSAAGNAGNLTIDASLVNIRDGGQVRAATLGLGNAGNVLIRASEVDIFETATYSGSVAGVFNQVTPNATGNAGNLIIEAERLSIRDGAQVTADTFGEGNAGNIVLRAGDLVEVAGSSIRRPTFVVADVNPEARGQGGRITIETKRLNIRDGAQVATSTFGTGDAGSLTVRADEVELFGRAANGSASGLFSSSQAEPGSNSSGGNLTIDAGHLSVRDGAGVSTSTFSAGNAGNLTIKADQLNISNSGQCR